MNTEIVSYDFLEPAAGVPRGRVTTKVADILRRAIVTLELAPGTTLDKNAICARLNVSRFPVSEAFARLQAEGLVDIRPQHCTSVSLIRIEAVREYMLIRKALEAEVASELAHRRPEKLRHALDSVMADQRRAAKADDREAFHTHDCAFHDILFVAMNMARLKTIIDSVRANVDRARRLSLTPRRYKLTLEEHAAIRDAILAGDRDAAATSMRTHIDKVLQELLVFAQTMPHLFADGGTFQRTAGPAITAH